MDAWARLRAVATASADTNVEREAAIIEAREAGWSFASIGSALGVSAQSVHAFVQRRNRDNEGSHTK